jgi:hypothetical protein
MKITFDLDKIFSSIGTIIGLLFAISVILLVCYSSILPLISSVIYMNFPDSSLNNSILAFCKIAKPDIFLELNVLFGGFIGLAFMFKLIDSSDWVDDDDFILAILVSFIFQEALLGGVTRTDIWEIKLITYIFFPTLLFLLRVYMKRILHIKKKLLSNEEMLKKLIQTDDKIRDREWREERIERLKKEKNN